MGCGCNKRWVFVAPDGTETTYKRRSEAEAAKVEAGGGRIVRG